MIAGATTTGERSEIRWGTTAIPYAIRRSSRRGTVSIAVEPSGRVVLTAPTETPVTRLDRGVRQKARWIVDRASRGREMLDPCAREFVSGETVRYLGRCYRLRVVSSETLRSPHLERGWLVVTTETDGPDRRQDVRKQVISWYRARAKPQLVERTAQWAEDVGVRIPELLIRDPARRWGSCDASGKIRLNWRIVQASGRLVDYVVVHELAHLVHRGHDTRFWSLVAKALPDYEARRKALREVGPSMVW